MVHNHMVPVGGARGQSKEGMQTIMRMLTMICRTKQKGNQLSASIIFARPKKDSANMLLREMFTLILIQYLTSRFYLHLAHNRTPCTSIFPIVRSSTYTCYAVVVWTDKTYFCRSRFSPVLPSTWYLHVC